MSNLTLPRMTFVTLKALLARSNRAEAKLAYETTLTYGATADTIVVRHHGNPIAHMGEHFITISGSGWNSQTTATRLRKILSDNQTPLAEGFDRTYYSVTSRDNRREFGLFLTGTTRNPQWETTNLRDIQHGSAHFSRVDSDHHFVLHGE